MTNLVTIEEYKESEGIVSLKDDLRLNNLIPSVSQLVKTYCGNSIVDYYSQNKIETININWDTHLVQLTESPVNTIVTVEERDSISSAYVVLTTLNHEIFLDTSTDTLFRVNGGAGYKNWKKGPGAVRVTYTAGYSACPADLKLAVMDLITYYLKDEHKERKL